jgi:signal transduction histidine kinase/tetratricopeptide (TPR) repeat protein
MATKGEYKQWLIFALLLLCSTKLFSQDVGIGSEYIHIARKRIDSLQKLLESTRLDTEKVNLLNLISKQYRIVDEFQSYIVATEALEKAEKLQFWKGVAESYINLGFINAEQGLQDLAIEMYEKGAEIAEKNNLAKQQIYCLNGIAVIYWERQKYHEAISIFFKNLALQKKLGLEQDIAVSYNNIGLIYNEFKEPDSALKYLLKAKAIRDKYNLEERSIATLNNLGIAYLQKGKLDTALFYSQKSLQLARKYAQKRRIKEATITLAEIYEAQKDYSNAFKYLMQHKQIRDTIEKIDKSSIIAEEKRKRDLEKREAEISMHRKNDLLQNIIYVLIIVFFVVVAVAAIHRAKRIQRFSETLQQKNDEINFQKTTIELQNSELLALNENLENIVKERTQKLSEANQELETYMYRFAHDLRGPLTTIMGLCLLGKMDTTTENTQNLFDKIHFTLIKMDSLLKKLSQLYQINHHQVMHQRVAIKQFVGEVLEKVRQKWDIEPEQIHFSFQGISDIMTDAFLLEISLENILENALIFSTKKPIIIDFFAEKQKKNYLIRITDQGQGIPQNLQSKVFDMFFRGNENSQGNGLGLYMVKKALEKLKGYIELSSEESQYTRIDLYLPI